MKKEYVKVAIQVYPFPDLLVTSSEPDSWETEPEPLDYGVN